MSLKIGDLVKAKIDPKREQPFSSNRHTAGIIIGYHEPKNVWGRDILVKFADDPEEWLFYAVALEKISQEEYKANAALCFIESCNE